MANFHQIQKRARHTTELLKIKARWPNVKHRRAWLTAALIPTLIASSSLASGESTLASESPRIKRISLMTDDLQRSISFFTEVIGFTLDFEGTLPPNSEPFLGPVFNIDSRQPIRRALLSTAVEARGLFLIEHSDYTENKPEAPRAVVTVVQVADLTSVMTRASEFGAQTSEMVKDVTPEGASFAEALVMSPAGHPILVYEYDATPDS